MLEGFAEWLSLTPANTVFSDTNEFWTWLIIPVSQCIHIVCVAIVMMSVGLLNMRLLGVTGTRQSFAQLTADLMPWFWTGLIVQNHGIKSAVSCAKLCRVPVTPKSRIFSRPTDIITMATQTM